MRSDFEKYIREQSGFTSDFQVGCNGQYKSDLMHFMFTTWCYQQSKLDDLQKRVDSVQRLLEVWKEEEQEGYMASSCVDKLEQALKGGDTNE